MSGLSGARAGLADGQRVIVSLGAAGSTGEAKLDGEKRRWSALGSSHEVVMATRWAGVLGGADRRWCGLRRRLRWGGVVVELGLGRLGSVLVGDARGCAGMGRSQGRGSAFSSGGPLGGGQAESARLSLADGEAEVEGADGEHERRGRRLRRLLVVELGRGGGEVSSDVNDGMEVARAAAGRRSGVLRIRGGDEAGGGG